MPEREAREYPGVPLGCRGLFSPHVEEYASRRVQAVAVMRSVLLALSRNRTANRLAKKYGLRFGATRFVAGDTIEKAVECIRDLNRRGIMGALNYLGEFENTEQGAAEKTRKLIETLDAIHSSGIDCNLTVKITSLGLDISKEICVANLTKIVEHAKKYNIFVRIEMEDYSHCQQTLDIYKEMRQKYDNVGAVIQGYLYRSEKDIEDLNQYKANLRLVKGAYKESAEVAFPKKADVDRNYEKIIKMHLSNGNYAAIASHDEAIIEKVKQFVKEKNIPKDQFEFQMLLGIRSDLAQKLANEGYRVRIYVPYGTDWYGYFMRRLAERPANVWFVLKNLFR